MDDTQIIPGTELFDTRSTGTNLGFINGVSDPVPELISDNEPIRNPIIARIHGSDGNCLPFWIIQQIGEL